MFYGEQKLTLTHPVQVDVLHFKNINMACSECEHQFSTFYPAFWRKEHELVDLIIEHGILRRSIKCEICGNNTALRKWSRGFYHYCGRGHLPFQKSARVNTFFGDSKWSIHNVMFFCLYWLLFPSPRQYAIAEELQCGTNTVVDWSKFNREVCVNWMLRNRKRIGGKNKIVEIDESRSGHRKHSRGSLTEGHGAFGGVEREDKSQFFLVLVEHSNRETLLQVIKDWILPGTIIVSDCWKVYDTVDHQGFVRLKADHSLEFVSTGKSGYTQLENLSKLAITIDTTPIEIKCKIIKYSIPCFGRKKDNFEGYLAEYIFKYVYSRKLRMHHFLVAAAALYPPPE